MVRRFKLGTIDWIDIEAPSLDEVVRLGAEFKLPHALREDLLSPTLRPRVDVFPAQLYMVFHVPETHRSTGQAQDHEIDLVVGKSFVLCVHYRPMLVIQEYSRTVEASALTHSAKSTPTAALLVFNFLKFVFTRVEQQLDAIEDSAARIEGSIFRGNERQMVEPLSRAAREVLAHRRALGNQVEIFEKLEAASPPYAGIHFKQYMTQLGSIHYRLLNRALSISEQLSELRSTNDSLLSTRQNEIMKNLTVVTSIMLPLSLITSVFGMNSDNMPIIGNKNDFWIIIFILIAVAALTTLFFRHKRWF